MKPIGFSDGNSNIGAAKNEPVRCKKCYSELEIMPNVEYYCKTCDVWYDMQLCRIRKGDT